MNKIHSMKEKEIIEHINNYISSGIIDDALIELYDQHGRWRGDTIQWNKGLPRTIWEQMKRSYLPSFRRTYRNRTGTVLRTSCIRKGDKDVRITYSEICGSLILDGNPVIHAPSLRRVGGNLLLCTDKRADFPNLRTVDGHLKIMRTFLFTAPRLQHVGGSVQTLGYLPPMLETVGGSLELYWSFDICAERLKHVCGCLILTKAETILFPVLEKIGGSLLPTLRARIIEAPKLQHIGGDFMASSVVRIRTPILESVGGNMDTTSAAGYYHPRIKVRGKWTTYPGALEEWKLRERARRAMKREDIML